MPKRAPEPLSPGERRARGRRVARVARGLGFAGRAEYRHVYSQTGGAQYAQGSTTEEDLLIVFAEAFVRDRDPDDFSLEAIPAHERGHQLVVRHPRISKLIAGRLSIDSEEILASLLGAILCANTGDRDALVAKATVELLSHGESLEIATRRLQELWNLLEVLL
jgi:hypothetical protein